MLKLCVWNSLIKLHFILNSWFLTKLNHMQLVSGASKAFSCNLTVDFDIWMDSLTSDKIFEVENMKFTGQVYLIIKSGF